MEDAKRPCACKIRVQILFAVFTQVRITTSKMRGRVASLLLVLLNISAVGGEGEEGIRSIAQTMPQESPSFMKNSSTSTYLHRLTVVYLVFFFFMSHSLNCAHYCHCKLGTDCDIQCHDAPNSGNATDHDHCNRDLGSAEVSIRPTRTYILSVQDDVCTRGFVARSLPKSPTRCTHAVKFTSPALTLILFRLSLCKGMGTYVCVFWGRAQQYG